MYVVFGAARHIGEAVTKELARAAGPTAVRVASSRAAGVERLQAQFPGVAAVQADFLDAQSMARALDGATGIFIVTPDFFDDRRGAVMLIDVTARLGVRPHIVRIQAEVPGVGVEQLEGPLADPIGRRGHLDARSLITASGLPATFLNVFGYYMDDLLIHFGASLARGELLVPYDRPMCWIDPRELGEAAARVLLDGPADTPRLLHLNNGEDGRRFAEVAAMIADATGRPIIYRDDADAFRRDVGPLLHAMSGRDDAADYLLADWRMERSHAALYRGTGHLEQLLGRRPRTLRAWIDEHREALAGPATEEPAAIADLDLAQR